MVSNVALVSVRTYRNKTFKYFSISIRYEHAHKSTVKKAHKKISKRHSTFLGDLSKKAKLVQQLSNLEKTLLQTGRDTKKTFLSTQGNVP